MHDDDGDTTLGGRRSRRHQLDVDGVVIVIGVISAGQTARAGTDGLLVLLLMHVVGAVTVMTVMAMTMITIMTVFMLVTVQMPMRSRIMIDGQFPDFVRMHERDDAHRQKCDDQ